LEYAIVFVGLWWFLIFVGLLLDSRLRGNDKESMGMTEFSE